jgi:hypothetical protein
MIVVFGDPGELGTGVSGADDNDLCSHIVSSAARG